MQNSAAHYLNVPFAEAILFFREKLNIPTEAWNILWKEQHNKGFTVAGAMIDTLLDDLREAVDTAISEGTTLAEFKKSFAETVAKHGWDHKGSAAWRAAIIYQTNLSTAYAAGRYAQQTSPNVLKVRPYLRYLPSSSANPRRKHMKWYNLVLPADDPFWDTHYPPNGWGCKCGVGSVSKRQFERNKDKWQTEAPEIETYEWIDKKTGQTEQVPVGIDPGWDYNPGKEFRG